MIKNILILATVCVYFCFGCYGQDWELIESNDSLDYKFTYWVYLKENESIKKLKKTANKKSHFKLRDEKGDTLRLVSLTIENIDTKEVTTLTTDYNGEAKIKLAEGNYKLHIDELDLKPVNEKFTIKENEYVSFYIKTSLSKRMRRYEINSKDYLDEKKIRDIIKCIEENKSNYFESCSDLKRYHISIPL